MPEIYKDNNHLRTQSSSVAAPVPVNSVVNPSLHSLQSASTSFSLYVPCGHISQESVLGMYLKPSEHLSEKNRIHTVCTLQKTCLFSIVNSRPRSEIPYALMEHWPSYHLPVVPVPPKPTLPDFPFFNQKWDVINFSSATENLIFKQTFQLFALKVFCRWRDIKTTEQPLWKHSKLG